MGVALRSGWPAPVSGHVGTVAFGERGDGEGWIDAEGAGDDRAVADVEPFVHRAVILPGEDLALVIDDSAAGVVAHNAAAEGMDGDQVVAKQFCPDGISGIYAF